MSEPLPTSDHLEPEPELADWLAIAREEADAPPADMGEVFAELERDIADAEKKKRFWIRTRPTWMRRGLAGLTAALIVLVGVVGLRDDFAAYPPIPMALALGSLAALLGLAVHQALRPLHRPPMSPLARGAVIALTLTATFLIALLSPHDPHDPASVGVLRHVSPCLFYGLLMGLPVYLVLRLLDRGHTSTSLLAACAAGLLGNLALTLHCPRNAPDHLMLAHFSVAALFVGGVGLVHVLVRALHK